VKQETATRLILGGLCALLLLVSFASWNLIEMRTAIQQVVDQTEERAMISETITNEAGDRTVTITSTTGDGPTPDPNEPWSAVVARHDARVTEWKDTH
jgi:hypothetical protein